MHDVDVGFVVSLLREANIRPVMDASIQPDMLYDHGRIGYDAAMHFLHQYGKLPALGTLLEVVPDLGDTYRPYLDTVNKPLEPLQYYVDSVRSRRALTMLNETVHEAQNLLETRDPAKVLASMKGGLFKVQSLAESGRVLNEPENYAEELVADYNKAKAALDGVFGYCTPWPSLNAKTAGLVSQDLWVIAARLGVGKTWWLAALIDGFISAGLRTLVISMEMPCKALLKRILAARNKIPALDLRMGRLATPVETKYLDALRDLKSLTGVLYMAGDGRIKTVADLEMLIEEVRPQVTVVDGIYLLDNIALSDDKMTEKVSKVITQAKQIAMRRNTGIVGSSQFNRGATGKEKGKAENLSFTDAIGQTADVAIGLWRDEDLKRLDRMNQFAVKVREGPGDLDHFLNWDLVQMNFTERHGAAASDVKAVVEGAVQGTLGGTVSF